jgi:hypothetical protein
MPFFFAVAIRPFNISTSDSPRARADIFLIAVPPERTSDLGLRKSDAALRLVE